VEDLLAHRDRGLVGKQRALTPVACHDAPAGSETGRAPSDVNGVTCGRLNEQMQMDTGLLLENWAQPARSYRLCRRQGTKLTPGSTANVLPRQPEGPLWANLGSACAPDTQSGRGVRPGACSSIVTIRALMPGSWNQRRGSGCQY
jgi:hypothetical protein